MRPVSIVVVAIAILASTVLVPPIAAAAADSSAIIADDACTATSLPANDDGYSDQVSLPFSINFYGTTYDHLWVNNNGNVTFNGPLSTYTPFGLVAAGTPIIAPFFADVDTRGVGSGLVKYGWGQTVYGGHQALCVDWVNVGYYASHTDKLDSFQLLIVSRPDKGVGAFDAVFNYDKLQWETGDASGGVGGLGGSSARVGLSNGTSTPGASLELRGSGVNGALLDSSPTGLIHGHQSPTGGTAPDGRYVFEIRGGVVLANRYVALGDSFQSGEGAYDYLAGTDGNGDFCHRSANAYPELLSQDGASDLKLDFYACSGAVIDSLRTTYQTEGPQLNHLSSDVRLITVGIGGNDLDFAGLVQNCVIWTTIATGVAGPLAPFTSPCQGSYDYTLQQNLTSIENGAIRAKLDALYNTIRKDSPYAQVVVVSYPRFFPTAGSSWWSPCAGVRVSDQIWMNDGTVRADAAIANVALAHGFSYVNMYDALNGHEQCMSDPWINGLKFFSPSKGIAAPESFHPNALGHASMAAAIRPVLQQDLVPRIVIMPAQTITRAVYVTGDAFHVNTAWPGSDVVTSLISPSGVVYSRSAPRDATHDFGPTWEHYDIAHPEQGTWTVEMYGADVDPAGESLELSTFDEPKPNVPPVASFTMTGSGATQHFDALASGDPDGSIVDYAWDFGDGSHATGAVVDHTFPAGQEDLPTLIVTDNAGAHTVKSADHAAGTVGSYFTSTITLTNSTSIAGPVHVAGDFSCNSNGRINGDLDATGAVYLTNNCIVTGSVRAGGSVKLDSTSTIQGNLISEGDLTFQSTARIGGSIYLVGSLISSDGKSTDYLTSHGQIGGTVGEGVLLPTAAHPSTADAVDSASQWPGMTVTSWARWMNDTAGANSAPSWSQGLAANPGCTMASWSVNGTVASLAGDTLIDATGVGCPTVTLQGMTLRVSGDVTILADAFSSVNGLTIQSADGLNHTLNIVSPGPRSCSSSHTVSLSASTTSDDRVLLNVDAAGKLTVDGTSSISGKVAAACLAASGSVTVGRWS